MPERKSGAFVNGPLLGVQDLGGAPAIDPFEVQSGAILMERFCVIGRVRHARQGWRVPVTDLQRQLGDDPNHRLILHYQQVDETAEIVLRRALRSHRLVGWRVAAIVSCEGGVLALTSPAEGMVATPPLSRDDALGIARQLCDVVGQLHASGLTGVRFDMRDVRVDAGGAVQFATLTHLKRLSHAGAVARGIQDDLAALTTALRTLADDSLDAMLADSVRSTTDLSQRLAPTPRDETTYAAADVLPAVAPFVGRGRAMLRVQQGIGDARRGQPSVVWIEAPRGVGKSRLVHELSRSHERHDTLQLVLRCGPGVRGLVEISEQVVTLVERLPRRHRDAMRARIVRAVGPLAPIAAGICDGLTELVGDGPALPNLPLDETLSRQTAMIAQLLSAIGSAARPLLLLIDDIDAADAATREMLHHLLTPGKRHHLAAVVTSQPGGSDGLVGQVRQVALEPLTDDELVDLIDESLPGESARVAKMSASLLEQSEGNPLAAWSHLRRWVDDGVLARHQGVWHLEREQSESVIGLTKWRLSRLTQDGRWVAATLAVSRRVRPREWLAQVTRWPIRQTSAALDELLRTGACVQHSDRTVEFIHDEIREQVVSLLDAEDIRAAHASVAQWYKRMGGGLEDAAWHAEHAAAPGLIPSLASQHVVAAQAAISVHRPRHAAWHAERALERGTSGAACRTALEVLGESRLLLGDIDSASEVYTRIFTEFRDEDGVLDLRLAAHVARALIKRGAADVCDALCSLVLSRFKMALPNNPIGHVLAISGAIWCIATGRRLVVNEALANEATVLFGELFTILAPVRPSRAAVALLRARACTVGLSSPQSAQGRAFFSVLYATRHTTRRLHALLDGALADAKAGNDEFAVGIVNHFRSQAEFELGNTANGQDAASTALAAFQRAGDFSVAIFTLATSVFYALDREPTDALLGRLDQLETAAWRQRSVGMIPMVHAMRLIVRWRQGQAEASAAIALAGELISTEDNQIADIVASSLLATVLARLGELDLAESVADRAVARRKSLIVSPGLCEVASVAQLEVRVTRMERDGSNDGLSTTLRSLRSPSPAFLPAVRLCQARAAIARGDLKGGRVHLVEAVDCAGATDLMWPLLDGHARLATLDSGSDIVAAKAHRERVASLSTLLQASLSPASDDEDNGGAPPEPAEEVPEVGDVPPTAVPGDLSALMVQLEETLNRALPPDLPLNLTVEPGLKVAARIEDVELMVVNLVLAVRDVATSSGSLQVRAYSITLDRARADAIGFSVGPAVRLRASSPGMTSDSVAPLIEACRELASQVGGVLTCADVSGEVVLDVWLRGLGASPESPSAVVGIVHSNPRIVRTIVAGVAQLGYAATPLSANETVPPDLDLIIVEVGLNAPNLPISQVVVIPRREAREVTEPHLPFPFLVDELEGVLTRVLDATRYVADIS